MTRAMSVRWSWLLLGFICYSESRCSPTSYYKSCWIRRYPGLYVDVEESQRRGAQVLRVYQEENALKCSRTCCLTPNFSCNLAVYHYNTTQDSVNCFHLQCPTLESCVPRHRGNVILYNITKGVDPDLLVFGKHFTTNVRVLPHMSSRLNISEPLTSDKRQFNHPPVVPNPPVQSISPASISTQKPTTPQHTRYDVPTAHEDQNQLPQCDTKQASTTPQSILEQVISTTSPLKMDPVHQQTSPSSQWVSTNLLPMTKNTKSTTVISQDDPLDATIMDALNSSHQGQNPSPTYITTAQPNHSMSTSTLNPLIKTQTFSTSRTTTFQQPLGLQSTTQSYTATETRNVLTQLSLNTTQLISQISTTAQQPSLITERTTSSPETTFATVEDYSPTTVQTTIFETSFTQTNVPSPSESSTTMKPLTAAQTNAPLPTSTLITTMYETSSVNWPVRTTTQSTNPSATATSQLKETAITGQTSTLKILTTTNPTITTVDSTTTRHLTLSFPNTHMDVVATTSKLGSTLTSSTRSVVDSQPNPNDTKGYISRNITTGDVPQLGEDDNLTSVWHLAANTVLVALSTCATITFGCCCSVCVALSWRGRRRRKGRYRTNLRGKRGSMKLIKYVIVRENS